ncbi:hypothetical protein GCM10010123_33280 [Pilimelia anulata]|uniref:DUF5666 domain-containing protein n=1 Tax=Pilimelia anulata TaxID=53371 RepID=A0A8J3FEJ2_9ACTN|nr:hypothetical protein [Pilimelia anulata]GGK00725.1 hypothetical protein GCM10010123_33280 [Pilimelia anulata]
MNALPSDPADTPPPSAATAPAAPTPAEPDGAEPDAAESDGAEPDAAEPDGAEPDAAESSTPEPAVAEAPADPSTADPAAAPPVAADDAAAGEQWWLLPPTDHDADTVTLPHTDPPAATPAEPEPTAHRLLTDGGADGDPPPGGHDPLAPAPPADGFADELAAAAPRRWWNRGTVLLGLVLVLGAGFLGGAYTQRAVGGGDDGGGRGRDGGRFPGGGRDGQNRPGGQNGPGSGNNGNNQGPGNNGGPGGQTGAAPITGTVKLVDGRTVYVQTADGEVVTVRTGTRTAVTLARPATPAQLAVGSRVTVTGAAADDGTVTATAVTGTAK